MIRLVRTAALVVALGACWTTKRAASDLAADRLECEQMATHFVAVSEAAALVEVLRGGSLGSGDVDPIGSSDKAVALIRERIKAGSHIDADAEPAPIVVDLLGVDPEPTRRDRLRDHCVADRWSVAVRRCFATTRHVDTCRSLLTAEQRTAAADAIGKTTSTPAGP